MNAIQITDLEVAISSVHSIRRSWRCCPTERSSRPAAAGLFHALGETSVPGIDYMDIQVGPMRAVTKLFLSNRSQAVRIPAHLRLPDSVKEVVVRACGQERIIAPLGRSWDSFFQGGPTVPDDFLEERASQQQGERESF